MEDWFTIGTFMRRILPASVFWVAFDEYMVGNTVVLSSRMKIEVAADRRVLFTFIIWVIIERFNVQYMFVMGASVFNPEYFP